MEESKQIPEENNSTESSPEIRKESNNEKVNSDLKVETKKNSLFKRILNDGFDGISSNPNYKMLALLIILLINLSLFFVIGNLGKAFLRNAGIM